MVRNYGKFYVTESCLKVNNFPQAICKMQLVPSRVEYRYDMQAFEYIATSPLFREVKEGESVPEYNIQIASDNNGNVLEVTAKEIL